MPVFAQANTAVLLTPGWISDLANSNSLGIFAGLFAGKSLGPFLFSLLAGVSGAGFLIMAGKKAL